MSGATRNEVLHEVVERLAPLDRTPCSAGEREAADWLAGRFRAIPGVDVSVDEEPSWGTFPPTATALCAAGLVAAALVRAGSRRAGALLAAAAFAGLLDEADNGPRIARRLIRRRRSTVNVIARVDGPGAGAHDAGTLVVLAHHDAPQTGMIFDQTLQKQIYERWPQLIERGKTPPPLWWPVLAGPLATLVGAITNRRRLTGFGLGVGALATGAMADVWRSETVQGANDNLSGVASLVSLAETLSDDAPAGLSTLLVSCGAEETLQDGIRAFVARHGSELDPGRTWFVNLETVGSPILAMLEAEGPVRMEYYNGPWLRDLVEVCAERSSVRLERGFRARASTDSVIPSRAGYPIATLVSITDWRSPANYHLATDVPANLDYDSVAGAVRIVLELARSLAERVAGAHAPQAASA
ncbi:MAG TPA: M28 family peptidase [Solirubrobacteraceae bacterium]|nr:M28 family peptidase [Solirubrobacteraceae bacterium]